MGALEDYIKGLEGRSDFDFTEVVTEMARLHNEEVAHVASTSTAKIEQLNEQLSEKETAIAARDNELAKAKAANWDLVNRIPVANEETPSDNDEGVIDQHRITLDDAFTS